MLPPHLTHGQRTDVTVEVLDANPDVPFEGVSVEVEDSDTQCYLVPSNPTAKDQQDWSPGDRPPADWSPGDRFRLEEVVPYDLEVHEELRSAARWGSVACPDCGGEIRYSLPIDLSETVLERFAHEDLSSRVVDHLTDRYLREWGGAGLLIADSETNVLAVTDEDVTDAEGEKVDDWQGQLNEPVDSVTEVWSVWSEDVPGTFVCIECNRETSTPERQSLVASESMHMLDASTASVNVSLDAVETAPAELGMAVGGAKDVANFRDNVAEGYVPQPDALSVEGLFYDYYFETGAGTPNDEDALFYPTYAAAVSADPFTGETERFLTVGLNSTLSTADFERKRLNLVVVLDVSGSMSSRFEEYYYDHQGIRREVEEPGEGTKIEAARESLVALTHHLTADDRFGVVLYNSGSHVAKPLREVGQTDMDAIRGHIRDLEAGGGTDMSAGFRAARELLDAETDADPTEVENRIIFMTDAMPNLGELGEDDLVDLIEDAAADGIHTTFVGMGLDTNAELVDALSAVRGANHYFVHSAAEFERRLGEEFAYMVTPLVFDLSLDLVADGYEIDTVYGSPDADAATGEVLHVSTLFPSPTREGETRGGVVLLKLRRTGTDSRLELVASWEERDGTRGRDAVTVSFPADGPEQFQDSGIRKAVLLARYAELLQEWASAVRADESDDGDGEPGPINDSDDSHDESEPVDDWEPMQPGRDRTQWEQASVTLTVPAEYAGLFADFREHLVGEQAAIGDDDLDQEADLLDELLEAA